MAYPDDLLQFAQEIANLHPDKAHQPSLRRAVSTGYYALFHLLISDAIANCTDPQFRAALARVFDHGSAHPGLALARRHCRRLQELECYPTRTGRSGLPYLHAAKQRAQAECEAAL
jgi:hypothetical protein